MATELITYSNDGGQSNDKAFASGLLTSDGTIANITVGFVPSKIVLYDLTNATNPDVYIWVKGLAVTNCLKITGATGVITKGVTAVAMYGDTSDDTITLGEHMDIEETSGTGFSIPAALLSDADTWAWEAWR